MERIEVPERCRSLYNRAMGGKSRQAAIRAFCLMCVGWVAPEVRRCTAPNCPLYPYRQGRCGAVESTVEEETTSDTRENEMEALTPL